VLLFFILLFLILILFVNENNLNFKVRQEGTQYYIARTRFLHHKTAEILDKEDLEKLWNLLKDNISPPNDMKERINYKFLYNFSDY
jgi:serine/threonine-protein phosphatase 2A regulatory subunit B''